MDIQSGRIEVSHATNADWNLHKIDADWNLHNGTGERIVRLYVPFKNDFTIPPTVVASLCRIDADKESNLRVSVDAKPEEVKASGFDLLVGTWSDSIVYGVTVTWIAYME